jgi:hypothetical protein
MHVQPHALLAPTPAPTRIVIGRDELLSAAQADPSQLEGVAALDIRGNFMFDPANHRDFLGALVGTGRQSSCVSVGKAAKWWWWQCLGWGGRRL